MFFLFLDESCLSSMVTFTFKCQMSWIYLCRCNKMSESDLGETELALAHKSIRAGKSKQRECKTADHITSTVKGSREIWKHVCLQLSSLSLLLYTLRLMLPIMALVFANQLMQSRLSPAVNLTERVPHWDSIYSVLKPFEGWRALS